MLDRPGPCGVVVPRERANIFVPGQALSLQYVAAAAAVQCVPGNEPGVSSWYNCTL